jgi:hypothetical protein
MNVQTRLKKVQLEVVQISIFGTGEVEGAKELWFINWMAGAGKLHPEDDYIQYSPQQHQKFYDSEVFLQSHLEPFLS